MHPRRYARLIWIAALACLVALIYWPSTLFLYGRWTDTAEETYTHGWLILLICIALVVRARHELVAAPGRPSALAALGLALAVITWLVAYRASIEGLEVPIQPLIFWLSVTTAFGWAVGRLLLFPVAYLYFAVNVWHGAPLQDLTVLVIARFLQEHAHVLRLITQPGEKRRGRIELPPCDISLAVIPQVGERFVEYGHITALSHRAKEGRRSCSRRAPQCENRHSRNLRWVRIAGVSSIK